MALKYGYDSPDSFTKAFLRFHGATPTAIRKGKAMIKSFAPLNKIVKKSPFTVVGISALFKFQLCSYLQLTLVEFFVRKIYMNQAFPMNNLAF